MRGELVNRCRVLLPRLLTAAVAMVCALNAGATDVTLPGLSVTLGGGADRDQVSAAVRILLGLTVLSLAPALLIIMTSFTRIIVVLSIMRHAFGMQQTPPNTVLISLALFLTLFNMLPVFNAINTTAYQPYMSDEIDTQTALTKTLEPLRNFMVRQTREEDLALMIELADAPTPQTVADVSTVHLVPAFILSELKMAFQIGFVVFLPFVLIDLLVASILMSMGMLMVPPMMISLPIKILMFVLIDGWNLVVSALMNSFA